MKVATLVPVVPDGRRQQAAARHVGFLLGGRPVLAHTLDRLQRCSQIEHIYLLVPPAQESFVREQVLAAGLHSKVQRVLTGGLLRQDCIHHAVLHLAERYEFLMIHDGNRPLVSEDLLVRTLAAAEVHGAAVAAVPVHDTIKVLSKDNFITASYERRKVRTIQTPSVFRTEILSRALESAARDNYYASDEVLLVERLGERIKVVPGNRSNVYVATREDLILAQMLLKLEPDALAGSSE